MHAIRAIIRNPLAIALVAALAIAGCATKKTPNTAADLGLGGAATPGSAQDFTVNVGDRIFFDTDFSVVRADAQGTLAKQARLAQPVPATTPSPSKAMPTSAARANITWRSAPAAPPPRATF